VEIERATTANQVFESCEEACVVYYSISEEGCALLRALDVRVPTTSIKLTIIFVLLQSSTERISGYYFENIHG
jgi:hypothetical protein